MAKLSEITGSMGITEQYREEAKKCCFCGEKISHGGMWSADDQHLGICEGCAPFLIDWYVDTLMDTSSFEMLSIDDKKNKVMETVNKRLEKKEEILLRMRNESGLKKLGINCYAEIGIIDLFGLSLSKEELKERIEFDSKDTYGSHFHSFCNQTSCSDIDNAFEEIKQIIKRRTGEEPGVIRFFAIPDFDYTYFRLYAIAKISNNGATFVFSNDSRLFNYLTETNGYPVIVEEI